MSSHFVYGCAIIDAMTERNTKKTWWIVLGCMICIIIALIVSIFVVKNLNQKPDEVVNTLSLAEQAQAEVDAMDTPDIPRAIEIYQKYLDLAGSDDEKIALWDARSDYIIYNDSEFAYYNQALNDQIAIDNILQSINSALEVLNVMYFYRNAYGELYNKYNYLLDQRQIDAGLDLNAETK